MHEVKEGADTAWARGYVGETWRLALWRIARIGGSTSATPLRGVPLAPGETTKRCNSTPPPQKHFVHPAVPRWIHLRPSAPAFQRSAPAAPQRGRSCCPSGGVAGWLAVVRAPHIKFSILETSRLTGIVTTSGTKQNKTRHMAKHHNNIDLEIISTIPAYRSTASCSLYILFRLRVVASLDLFVSSYSAP